MSESKQYEQHKGVKAVSTLIKLNCGTDCLIGAPNYDELEKCIKEINPNFNYSVSRFQRIAITSRLPTDEEKERLGL